MAAVWPVAAAAAAAGKSPVAASSKPLPSPLSIPPPPRPINPPVLTVTKSSLSRLAASGESAAAVAAYAATMAGQTFHHHFHVLADLRTLLGSRPAVYAEIGSHNGGSLILMLQHALETSVVAIDPLEVFADQHAKLTANVATFNAQRRRPFVLHRKFSTDPALLSELHAEAFAADILFVDGEHSRRAVRADWAAYAGFVRVGGFLVFDDYGMADSADVKLEVDAIVGDLEAETSDGDAPRWEVWGQIDNKAGAPPASLAKNNEFILRRIS